MIHFLERYSLPRLNQEEIENINRPIISTKNEAVILKIPNKQNPKLQKERNHKDHSRNKRDEENNRKGQ